MRLALGAVASFTSTFSHPSGIVLKWNFLNPAKPLMKPTATLCFKFFGFIRQTCCPMMNCTDAPREYQELIDVKYHMKVEKRLTTIVQLVHDIPTTKIQLNSPLRTTATSLRQQRNYMTTTVTTPTRLIRTCNFKVTTSKLYFFGFAYSSRTFDDGLGLPAARSSILTTLAVKAFSFGSLFAVVLCTNEVKRLVRDIQTWEGTLARLNQVVHNSPHPPQYLKSWTLQFSLTISTSSHS
jgi:hypothetical protein